MAVTGARPEVPGEMLVAVVVPVVVEQSSWPLTVTEAVAISPSIVVSGACAPAPGGCDSWAAVANAKSMPPVE